MTPARDRTTHILALSSSNEPHALSGPDFHVNMFINEHQLVVEYESAKCRGSVSEEVTVSVLCDAETTKCPSTTVPDEI